jgi:hypothetical protein
MFLIVIILWRCPEIEIVEKYIGIENLRATSFGKILPKKVVGIGK